MTAIKPIETTCPDASTPEFKLTGVDMLLVVGVPILAFMTTSSYALFQLLTVGETARFDDWRLVRTLTTELALALLIFWRLSRGHYSIRRFLCPWQWKDLLRGCGVFITTSLVVWALALASYLALGPSSQYYFHGAAHGSVSSPAAVIASLLNPFAEEVYFLVIVVQVWQPRSVVIAGLASVLLRVSIHTYQGFAALTAVLPLAIIYTAFYIGSKRLWPIIVAHALQDLVGFALLSTR